MPAEGPGRRYSVPFTKSTVHGAPCVENKHAGIAAKSGQEIPIADLNNSTLLTAAVTIDVGEEAVIMLEGLHDVAVALCPGGVAAVGDQLWILTTDNTLQAAAGANRIKFGLVSDVDTVRAVAHVNLSQRSSF